VANKPSVRLNGARTPIEMLVLADMCASAEQQDRRSNEGT